MRLIDEARSDEKVVLAHWECRPLYDLLSLRSGLLDSWLLKMKAFADSLQVNAL
jgi:hypothetical protein